ncbi:MerR family transcriptional regulator [Streptomyces hesseae]|uniref:MerR family transcriptional regulator n=1 Tax=Streptomyces hesseae TaxID=3075519 RepID=A0ABU2SIS7_9ACTN|nr:MerR family transcriptional regulator [Streptomyces sp. DSM 40473]MDT0448872.1 MerR family transcriptional regulator [Streptomyces sp. DSM 40473]
MDDDTTRYSIGELARLTGLTVKTIRFWSDAGVVPPTDRTPAGYRLYGPDALARLGLVRTLRELGVGLSAVQRVLGREVSVAQIAAVHADALDRQIRTLRMHRAVLRAVAVRGSTPEELETMHKLAQLSERERHRLIGDFIDNAFEGIDVGPDFLAMLRDAMPMLPDDPTPEQVDAWIELAGLVQDDGFRAAIRRAAADQVRARDEAGELDPHAGWQLAELIRTRTDAAREAGTGPDSPAARPVVDELTRACAEQAGRADGPGFRAWLLERLEIGDESGYERYWQLVSAINGWPEPRMGPAVKWLIAALRAYDA